ncbi:MAG TPA: tetratricopeptide repeat protein, partial [Candidatus Udaeobacter sp.]|nr:tetratricopeptide repeat protein [Candidatus Udaeobacter sp.]
NRVDAHVNLGNALYDKGDLDGAIIEYRVAIQLNPKDPKASYDLGNALSRQGKFDQAIAAYQVAIGIDPKFSSAHRNLGMLLHKIALSAPVTVERTLLLIDACAALKQAAALSPSGQDNAESLHELDALLHGHCLQE